MHQESAQLLPESQAIRCAPLSTVWVDVAVVAAVTVGAAWVCAAYDVSEWLRRWAAPWERIQLDELPIILVVLAAGLSWFAARRYGDATRELAERRAAERRLAMALAENRRLGQHHVEMQEAERKHLARELHDELGQHLNRIKLEAVGIRDSPQADRDVIAAAESIIESTDHAYTAVGGLIARLRPVALDELGLAAAIEHCAARWRDRSGRTSLSLRIASPLEGIPETVAITAYRTVQESLTNAAKHSGAGTVSIAIAREEGPSGAILTLQVVDDGRGADLSLPARGLGLVGMRERIAALGGMLDIVSAPDAGFRLSAQIPIRQATGGSSHA